MSINKEKLKEWIEQVNKKLAHLEANQIAIINGDFCDTNTEPKDPLIKDEKIRKAVRAWADVNDYKKCLVRVYDYDRMGVHFSEGVTSFVSYDTKLGITFFCVDLNIKTETVYTIAELCGEEEV